MSRQGVTKVLLCVCVGGCTVGKAVHKRDMGIWRSLHLQLDFAVNSTLLCKIKAIKKKKKKKTATEHITEK